MNHTRRDTITGWILVAIQGALIVGIVFAPRNPMFDGGRGVDAAAWGLIGVGAVLGLWGFLHLGDGLTPLPLPNGAVGLVTSGPYRIMRHPIYTAVMLGMAGIAFRTRSPIPIGLAVVLMVYLGLKARWEERHLLSRFDGYASYAATTPRFLPLRLGNWGKRPGSGRRHYG